MNNERQHPISVLCVDVDNAGTRSFELSAMVHASLTLCGKAKKTKFYGMQFRCGMFSYTVYMMSPLFTYALFIVYIMLSPTCNCLHVMLSPLFTCNVVSIVYM